MDVRDDMRILREDHHLEPTSTPPPGEPLSIALVTTPNVDAQFGSAPAAGYTLAPVKGDKPPASLTFGFFILGGGSAFGASLAQHVHASFPGWTTTTVESMREAKDADVVVTPGALVFGSGGAFSHMASVTLTAKLKDGRVIKAVGTSDKIGTGGHLGWAIPAIIVTGLTGLVFVGPTLRAVNNGADEKQYAAAVDLACTDLLEQLRNVAPKRIAKADASP